MISHYVDQVKIMMVEVHNGELSKELIDKYCLERFDKKAPSCMKTEKKITIPRSEFWDFLLKNRTVPSILHDMKPDIIIRPETDDSSDSEEELDDEEDDDYYDDTFPEDFPILWDNYISRYIYAALQLFPTSQVIELETSEDNLVLRIGFQDTENSAYLCRCQQSIVFTSFNTVPPSLQPFVLEMSGLPLQKHEKPSICYISKTFHLDQEEITLMWESRKKCDVFSEANITNDDFITITSSGKPLACFDHQVTVSEVQKMDV